MCSENITYDRPFITYDEQINKLRDEYGLVINDNRFAIEALSTISYYDLINGYQECFKSNGKYFDGISIEYLYNFYLFDKGLQNILIKHSLLIENIFKTKLSYIIAKNVGVDAKHYLDPKHYKKRRGNPNTYKVLDSIRKVYLNEKDFIDNPTRHYLETKNHIPPWILFKNVNFINVIDLYSILGSEEKFELTNEIIPSSNLNYDIKVEHLKNSLTIIRKFRNKIAHNLKFITYDCTRFRLAPIAIKELTVPDLITGEDGSVDEKYTRVFKFFLAIVSFYNSNPYLLNRFLFDVMINLRLDAATNESNATFNDYHLISHLPQDLESRVEKCINTLSKSGTTIN